MTSIRERNRQLILDSAAAEFAETGFAATKIQDVAARAAVPKSNVFYYFLSKEDLYCQVLLSVVEPSLEASALLREEDDDPQEALAAFIRAKLRINQDMPRAAKVFASEMLLGAPRLPRHSLEQLNAETRRHILCLQGWMARGLLAPVAVQHLLLTLWASTQAQACFDWQTSRITGKDEPDARDFDAAAETITRLVVQGTAPTHAGMLV
ncbi:TetR/AcrR family transcriptional regulator [Metapseudomonas resinovorans]|uniref:TetR/AcrR family transcriptional regulator n=1 Tax=Metapseudomonas resinovorans TaxID=53412 RepID=UPI0009856875|nr:TetR/AcrR family transcriptional regulator [Pseudomonas resinovorans]